jgi:hypothetical protein
MFRNVALAMVATVAIFGASVAKADPVGGNVNQIDVVKARGWVSYSLNLHGKEPTRIRVNGDGGTRLTLQVFDEFDNLVKSDTIGAGDDREVTVTPRWTGKFTIKISNYGNDSNLFRLRMD